MARRAWLPPEWEARCKQLTLFPIRTLRQVVGEIDGILKVEQIASLLCYYRSYGKLCYHAAVGNFDRRNWVRSLMSIQESLYSALNDRFITYFWNRRFEDENKLPLPWFFGDRTTLIVDTFPIYINRPSFEQSVFYNGKYGSHVLKYQIVTDNRGFIVSYSGPHVGTVADVTIWRRRKPKIEPSERVLADKAYIGGGSEFICQFKKKNRDLSQYEKDFNLIQGFFRGRVEHVIGFVKNFGILNSVYRGKKVYSARFTFLEKAISIIFNITNLYFSTNQFRNTLRQKEPWLAINSDLILATKYEIERKRERSEVNHEEGMFEVSKILCHKGESQDKLQFFIRWKGHPECDCTWETVENLKHLRCFKKYWHRNELHLLRNFH